jgi:hypothetical protein
LPELRGTRVSRDKIAQQNLAKKRLRDGFHRLAWSFRDRNFKPKPFWWLKK